MTGYLRALRLLPAGYRERWEDDMVSTMLATLEDQGRGRPKLRELASVALLAFRLRLSGNGSSAGTRWWADMVHRVALLVLGFLAAVSTAAILTRTDDFVALYGRSDALVTVTRFDWWKFEADALLAAIWSNVGVTVAALGIAVFLAAALNRPGLAALLAVPHLAGWAVMLLQQEPVRPRYWIWWVVMAAAVLGRLAVRRGSPPLPARPFLIWYAAVTAAGFLPVPTDFWAVVDTVALCSVVFAVVGLAHLAHLALPTQRAARRTGPASPWTAALALTGAVLLLMRLVGLLTIESPNAMVRAVIQAVGVAIVATILAVAALGAVRRVLPATPGPGGTAR